MEQIDTRHPRRRKESLIGVCAAFGEDFGFHPDLLRVVFALMLLVNAEATLIAYAAAGGVVILSRLLFPASAGRTAGTSA